MKNLNKQIISGFVILFFIDQLAIAQKDYGFKPAASNIQGAEFPKISVDNSVYVRLMAPQAMKVQVQGGDGLCPKPLDLVKDTAGNWNAIIPSAGPGFHYYWFIVDDVRVNDPGSDTYQGYNRPTGGIEIPTPGEDFFLAKNVPHGDLREHWYYSDITENGDARLFTHHPNTISIQRKDILSCIFFMGPVKMKEGGRSRDI